MSGGGGNQSTVQTNEPPAYLQPFLQQLAQAATGAFRGGQLGAVAPFDPAQLAAQQGILNFAGGQANVLPGQSQAALQNALQLSQDPTQNPFLASTVQAAIRPLEQQFAQTILPGISDQSVVAGQVGQSRQGVAQGIAGQELLRQTGDITQGLYGEAFQQAQRLLPLLLSQAPGVAQFQTFPQQLQEAVGVTRQAQQQAELGQQQSALNAWAQLLGQTAFGGVQTTTGPQPGTSPLLGALGGAATGASIGSVVPGLGTGIGAGLGALIGFFG